ncbi:MAG TPA: efflux RND transporter periplasmic adaptor subunit, partial [Candidatus Woesebacteria bacterium]|nr:efflux RND transporter periplasmic adaptor subunit [Candidatus Woesebacteria bacterium]
MNILKSSSKQLNRTKNWFLKSSLLTKGIIVVIIFAVGWFSYTSFVNKETTQPQYQTAQVEKGNIIASVTASGQVTSSNNASVNTQATGVVKKIYATNGQAVKAGDPIAELTLDQASQQRYSQSLASYQSAQNSVTSAQIRQLSLQATMFQKWDTFKELAESSTYTNSDGSYNYINRALPEFHIPENEWLAAEAEYKNQEKVIAQAQTSLNAAWLSLQQSSPTIYAPIAGTVSGLTLQVGSVISSSAGSSDSTTITSQKIASVTTEASPMISVSLTEIDVLHVTVGDKVTITFDALADKTYTGKVVSIDTIGSVNSGVTNYPTLIALDNQHITILPNMSASASIITDTKNNV